MITRKSKIEAARKLLSGEPPEREQRFYFVIVNKDGSETCQQPGWPDEVKRSDIVTYIHIHQS